MVVSAVAIAFLVGIGLYLLRCVSVARNTLNPKAADNTNKREKRDILFTIVKGPVNPERDEILIFLFSTGRY